MKFDELLEAVGEFGPYQKRVYLLLCLPVMLCGAQVLSAVFIKAIPAHRCQVPGYTNDTYEIQSGFHQDLINRSLPSSGSAPEQYSKCRVYASAWRRAQRRGEGGDAPAISGEVMALHRWTNVTSTPLASDGSGGGGGEREERSRGDGDMSTRQCDEWVYDQSELDSTVITEFDVVCDDTILRSICQSVTFAGALVGSVVMGVIADVFGRKKAIFLSVLLQFVTSLAIFFTPNFAFFIAMKSFSGIATHSLFAIGATMGMELVGPGKRTFTGIVVEIFWAVGVLLVLPIAYLWRNWRYIQLVICILTVPLFSLLWLLPESPRWLLSERRYSEAEQVLERICRSNKTKLPQGALHEDTASDGPQVRLAALCSNRRLVGRTLVIIFNWWAVNVVYYGLALYTDNLSGSKYLNYLLGACLEMLAYVICLFLLERTGRRTFHCFCVLVGGAFCLATILPLLLGGQEYQWMVTAFALVGRMCASGAYAILYIMSTELFPTVVRNSAIGVCSIFENVGGMGSSYIADMGLILGGPFSSGLPMLVFGSVSVLAGVLSLTLPETKDCPLPETIEDAIYIDKPRQTGSPANAFISPMLDCNSCTPLSSSQL